MKTHQLKLTHTTIKSQRGATLVVALVLLTVVTIIGLASIRSSNLELKMAASARDRAIAFEKAEMALALIQQDLIADPPSFADLVPGCDTGAGNCFTRNCIQGRCFSGDVEVASKSLCQIKDIQGTTIVEKWRDDTTWETAGLYGVQDVPKVDAPQQATVSGAVVDDPVKYLIEFLCFTPRSDSVMADETLDEGVPLYRISARASGDSGRSSVILQSVFKLGRLGGG